MAALPKKNQEEKSVNRITFPWVKKDLHVQGEVYPWPDTAHLVSAPPGCGIGSG